MDFGQYMEVTSLEVTVEMMAVASFLVAPYVSTIFLDCQNTFYDLYDLKKIIHVYDILLVDLMYFFKIDVGGQRARSTIARFHPTFRSCACLLYAIIFRHTRDEQMPFNYLNIRPRSN